MSAPGTTEPTELIDTDRHPLDDPRTVERVRRDLGRDGCCVLTDFIRAELRPRLEHEGALLAEHAYYEVETVNVYNTDPDPALPDDHPARTTMRRGNAFVARDLIPEQYLIHRLYRSEPFRRFLAECFGLPEIHELADPYSGLVLNVIPPGCTHPWHFDTNEFTVSMLTQLPVRGGTFEYCPHIRSAGAENFADVRAVLDDDADPRVRRLALRPGDLQLFTGRYSLHRVTGVGGPIARHSAIFAYSGRPGVIGTPARTRQLFGRVAPEHLRAEQVRGDALLD
jgi:hypothetical protein